MQGKTARNAKENGLACFRRLVRRPWSSRCVFSASRSSSVVLSLRVFGVSFVVRGPLVACFRRFVRRPWSSRCVFSASRSSSVVLSLRVFGFLCVLGFLGLACGLFAVLLGLFGPRFCGLFAAPPGLLGPRFCGRERATGLALRFGHFSQKNLRNFGGILGFF